MALPGLDWTEEEYSLLTLVLSDISVMSTSGQSGNQSPARTWQHHVLTTWDASYFDCHTNIELSLPPCQTGHSGPRVRWSTDGKKYSLLGRNNPRVIKFESFLKPSFFLVDSAPIITIHTMHTISVDQTRPKHPPTTVHFKPLRAKHNYFTLFLSPVTGRPNCDQ